jgi:TM2 domain-containing membrane protein YozV
LVGLPPNKKTFLVVFAMCAFPGLWRGIDQMALKRVLSGIQPTGTLHLGNYIGLYLFTHLDLILFDGLGALKQWVDHQEQYENYFCVVDLHAITLPHSPQKLRNETLQAVALYLAAGIFLSRLSVSISLFACLMLSLSKVLTHKRVISSFKVISPHTLSSLGFSIVSPLCRGLKE